MADHGYDGKELISQSLSVKARKLSQGCYSRVITIGLILIRETRRYGANTR